MDWNDKIHKPKQKSFDDFFNDILNNPGGLFTLLIVLVIVSAVLTSFYTVEPEEEAVVTRLGAYLKTAQPGLQFKAPFGIDRVTKLKTKAILEETFGFVSQSAQTQRLFSDFDSLSKRRFSRNPKEESLMLTGDLNVADVEWVVQYKVANPRDYLFNIRDPQKNIRDISQATMRNVVGDRTVNDVLTVGRNEVAEQVKEKMQHTLDQYQMGVHIALVKLQDVNPPESVQPSFNEVNAAKQEQEEAINKAEAYYNRVIPEAKGKAEQDISEAKGFAAARINQARGDADKFLSILKEYRSSPNVTRTRLYIEVIEDLLKKFNSLTIVDPEVEGVLPVFGDTRIARTKKEKQ